MEQTIVLVKPDGVQRGLIGEIIHRFERKGLKLAAIKMVSLDDAILDEWYAHHKDKPFFGSLKAYMKSYPIVAMVWEGLEAVVTAMSQQYNLIQSSENAEIAAREVALMFNPSDIFSWQKTDHAHVYVEEERKK
jgi:nucleoside-diphosphate kinase